MFKLTFKFALTFTSAFLLDVITWVPFVLGSWNLVCYFPTTKPSLLELPLVMPWMGLEVKIFNMSNLGTFYTRKLTFGMLLTLRPNLQFDARFAPGSCPRGGEMGRTMGQDVEQVRFYIDIYVRICLGGHNLDTFYSRKLKLGMLLTQT